MCINRLECLRSPSEGLWNPVDCPFPSVSSRGRSCIALQGARRIVAEWPALDEEAREFTARILGTGPADFGSDSPKATQEEVPERGVAHHAAAPHEEESILLESKDRGIVDLESKAEL